MKALLKISTVILIAFLLITNISLSDNQYIYNSYNVTKSEYNSTYSISTNSAIIHEVTDKSNNGWFMNLISNPIVNGALLVLAIVGITIELFIPNYGIAGFLSIISLILFFLGNFSTGYADIISLLLFVVGCIFIILEILIPGFGILGILGIVFFIVGILTSISNIIIGLIAIIISAFFSIIAFLYIIRKGYKNKFINKAVLEKEIKSTSSKDYNYLIDKRGMAITAMRPSGIILIEDNKYDAITEGEYLSKNTNIVVIKIEGFKIIVRRIN